MSQTLFSISLRRFQGKFSIIWPRQAHTGTLKPWLQSASIDWKNKHPVKCFSSKMMILWVRRRSSPPSILSSSWCSSKGTTSWCLNLDWIRRKSNDSRTGRSLQKNSQRKNFGQLKIRISSRSFWTINYRVSLAKNFSQNMKITAYRKFCEVWSRNNQMVISLSEGTDRPRDRLCRTQNLPWKMQAH